MTREAARSLALNAAVARRLQADPDAVLSKMDANLAQGLNRHVRGQAALMLGEWLTLRNGPQPVDALVEALTSPSELAIEMRQNSPFAGVLTMQERADAYAEALL
ncbi:hypothetical protein ACXR2U_00575 [Jatrophihabitans sp. YIM 134969]